MGASKVIKGYFANYDGVTDVDALIVQENRSSVLNNPGDEVTFGTYETFSFTTTFDLVSGVEIYDVILVDRADHDVQLSEARGKIYVPADTAGTYEIDGVGALNKQGFDSENEYPPDTRSVNDENPVEFLWPTNPASITGEVQFTSGGSLTAVTGSITYITSYGTRYLWRLPYSADNKPDGEGFARFRLTDSNGRVEYSQINYLQAGSGFWPDLSLNCDVVERVGGTTINLFTGETPTISIACVDADGEEVDLTGLTLTIAFESKTSSTDIATVASGSITISGASFSFAIPSAVTANPSNWLWSLRKSDGNTVLMHGVATVARGAKADA